ncbi:hypothetical protein BPAE_0007g00080 [Botrytis paeoniae]|uniref:NACHT domain-containing protein n=1 Tax=Botrytis paeoniae TaxID=278948 RepID=A0A4Z1FZY6_9HELO|nr:hypothetical protein BPAE_0007g00080 [Botrytis paeoniae]
MGEAVTEKHEPASPKGVYLIEGSLLDLWQQASEDFERSNAFQGYQKKDADCLSKPDIEFWLWEFKRHRHPDDKFKKVSKAIGQHLYIIQSAMKLIKFGTSIASSLCAAASPASLVVSAFAFLFDSLVKVSEDFDKIELFFGEIAKTFNHLKNLDGRLDLAETEPLKESIIEIFVCSLDICKIGLLETEKRFKKWLQKMRGDDKLDASFKRMQAADDQFSSALRVATVALGTTVVKGMTDITAGIGRKRFQEILNWLSRKDFFNTYQKLREEVEYNPNAGKWLLNSKQFRRWRDQDCRGLWYTGPPGIGKSVIASIIINNLLRLPSQTNGLSKKPLVCYIFLSYKTETDVKLLLGSVVRQVQSTCDVPEDIKNKFDNCNNEEHNLGKEELLRFLSLLIEGRRLYIVVDALDECPWKLRKPLLDCFWEISSKNAVVKILITSRIMEDLTEYQKPFATSEIMANDEDMIDYINNIIEEHSETLREHEDEIRRIVPKKSSGMFIIARLHMDALVDTQVDDLLMNTLYNLPETLDARYESTLERIRGKREPLKDIAEKVLAWVSYAIEPLSVQELRHALATNMVINGVNLLDDANTMLNEDGLFNEKYMTKENDITAYCCGLVVVDIDNDVRFVHRSVQEYFEKKKMQKFPDFEYQIALACAKYLTICAAGRPNNPQIQSELEDQDDSTEEIYQFVTAKLKDFPFSAYASKYLHLHIHRFRAISHVPSPPASLNALIQQLLNETTSRQLYSYLLHWFKTYYSKSEILDDQNEFTVSDLTTTLDILHVATFLGSVQLVEDAIKSNDIKGLDSYGQSALVVAFKNDLDDIAEILLDHGATVDLSTRKGHALLLYAAEKNYFKIVEKIVGNLPDDGSSGFLKILGLVMILVYDILSFFVNILIFRDPNNIEPARSEVKDDTNIMNDDSLIDYKRFLSFAYHGEREELCDIFAVKRIDPKLIKKDFSSSDKFNSNYSSDNNLYTSYRRSADGWKDRIQSGDEDDEIEDALPKVKALFIKTACFLAIERVQCSVVETLLENGIDVNLKNYQGQSLLHRATAINSREMVETIIGKKPEVNLRDNNGRTALMAYADLNRNDDHGASMNLLHIHGGHEMYEAAIFGATGVVKFYLKHGIDPSIVNIFGWTPLHCAAANGHLEVVRVLLGAKANPSSIGDTGKTPLDFVESGKMHNNGIELGKRHYGYLERRRKRLSPQELDDRRDLIRKELIDHGAKTSDELLAKIGEDQFKFGPGGQYTHKGCWGDSAAKDIKRVQGL